MQQVTSYYTSVRVVLGILLLLAGTRGSVEAQATDGTELFAGDFVKSVTPELPIVGNRWNLLRLSLSNPYERAVDLQVALYFDIDSRLQYSRRVQIPPLTHIRTWLPVLVPDTKHIVDRAYSYHVLVRSLGDSTGLIPDRFGSMQLDRTLQYETNEPSVGIIHSFPQTEYLDTEVVESLNVGALEFLLTGRFKRGIRRNWKTLSPDFANVGDTGLQSLDQIVLANNEPLNSPQTQTALRRWMFGGGHLWVMLDRVDSKILELILEDRFQGQELERVELTNITLVDAKNNVHSTQEYETPVEMTRLLIDNVDVLFSVDGWPAAFTIDYGQGELLVTTLGLNGWGRPRQPSNSQRNYETDWERQVVSFPALDDIFSRFLTVEEKKIRLEPVLTEQVEGSIGFQVPPRSRVIGILMGYALLSVGLAFWLGKSGRLVWFGACGPVLALLAAGTLLGMRPAGWDVPPTAVVSQLVTPISGTRDVAIDGVVGFYATEASPLSLSGNENSRMQLDLEGFRHGIRILTYDDDLHWSWENLTTQPGLHTAEFESTEIGERVEAVATLNAEGVTGTLSLPEGLTPEDAIIDYTQGRIGVQFMERGQWTALENDTLSDNEFLNANLLGDEQRRRVAILSQLLDGSERLWNSRQPHLLFWTRPWEIDLNVDDNYQREGEALVAVPIELQRPPANSRITIPGPLLPYREVTGPDGKRPAGLYNRKKQEWLEKKYTSSTWLGFEIPEVLLPLSLEQVDVQIAVTGPVGQLELWVWDGERRVSLRKWEKPVGQLSATFDQNDNLMVSADGRLLLYLSAGEGTFDQTTSEEQEPRSDWRIESFDLSLQATTLKPEP
ncbi:MAG: hypothetical protein HUJ26_03120 [Planctomycetaceae bacterium]|nr:hypothetical protein [Planctomycetaceae bacterium]